MSLNTEDVAYLVALVEKSPSNYPRRKEIVEALQNAWRMSSRNRQPWRVPVEPESVGIIEFDASQRPA